MKETTANLLGYSAIVLWSAGALFVSLSEEIPEFLFISIVHFSCFILLSSKWLVTKTNPIPFFINYPRALLLTLVGIGGNSVCFVFSLHMVSAPVEASLINYLWPTLAVLLASFLPEHKFQKEYILGTLIAFLGVALLVIKPGELALELSAGHGLAFLGALVWVFYSVGIRVLKEQPSDIVTVTFLVNAIIMYFIHLINEPQWQPNLYGLSIMLSYGITAALAFYFWDVAMKYGKMQVLNVSSNVMPLLSTGLLIIFGKADFTFSVIGAACIIILGTLIASKESVLAVLKKAPNAPPEKSKP